MDNETVQGQHLWFVSKADGVHRGPDEWPSAIRVGPDFILEGDYDPKVVSISDDGGIITFNCMNGMGIYTAVNDDSGLYELTIGTSVSQP